MKKLILLITFFLFFIFNTAFSAGGKPIITGLYSSYPFELNSNFYNDLTGKNNIIKKGTTIDIGIRNAGSLGDTGKILLDGKELTYGAWTSNVIYSIYFHFDFQGMSCLQVEDKDGNKSDCYYINDFIEPEIYSISDISLQSDIISINGKNLYGFDYKGTLSIIINGKEYKSNMYNQDSTIEKINFKLIFFDGLDKNYLDTIDNYKIKFCPYSEDKNINLKYGICIEKQFKITRQNYTNDTYSFKQYRLKELGIIEAWKEISNPKEVIIAVIDDGVNINHPDLDGSIWINKNEKPGNGIDDDKNGYIDDFNGWNFVYESNNLLPLGSHGTRVAGIIGAKTDNFLGIAGITKNVKIMPIGVCVGDGLEEQFGYTGCTEENIIKGIKYAVDNGANIINLSLGGNQFSFTNSYDDIIQYAASKGVIIVIAGGNGDILSNNNDGVNTDVNKLSPLCNEKNKYDIFGVGAFTKEGYRTNWGNYGKCVDFYTPGEDIISTSILAENSSFGQNYNIESGTSFSAPILTGIIGLGFNKYGKVEAHQIHTALLNSLTENSVGNYNINTKIYLDELGKINNSKSINNCGENSTYKNGNCVCNSGYESNSNNTTCIQKVKDEEIKIKTYDLPENLIKKVNNIFEKIKQSKGNLSDERKIIFYKKLQSQLNNLYVTQKKEQNRNIINYLQDLIKKELSMLQIDLNLLFENLFEE